MSQLAAIVLTRNEARHIQDCLATLSFADQIIVFDSLSTDDTQRLARDAGAQVIEHPFQDYAHQRNAALEASSADWVLFVDADERVSEALAAEITRVLDAPQHTGYWIPRHNYIFGKLTRHTGWYPDYQMRLLHRDTARYDLTRPVHELVILKNGEAGYFSEPLVHYNYDTVAQFHEKQRRYAAFDAHMLYKEGIRPKPYTPYTQAVRHFKWRFGDLHGYRDGWHGLRLSALMAWYEYRKYRHLQDLWRAS
ncbi:MAG: glycosyltransferase family 2 protein [Anaerolineales bacterium]